MGYFKMEMFFKVRYCTVIPCFTLFYPMSNSPKCHFSRLHFCSANFYMYLSLIGIILRWGFLIWELIFIYCGLFFPHLGSFFFFFFFVLFLLSLRFSQISPLAFFRWFLPRPRIGMLSLVTVSPVITAFHSCCLSHHVFDQVNLWPAWVGFETAIFCYPRLR